MRYGLLLGMAMVLSLSLPAMGGTVNAGPDSIIIGNATVVAGQSSVAVPVYFVTHGDVTYFNLPLEIEGAGDVRFHGQQAAATVAGGGEPRAGGREKGGAGLA